MSSNDPGPIGEIVRCANPRCGQEFTRFRRRGRLQKFCSVRCGKRDYEQRHARLTRISQDELRRIIADLLAEMLVEADIVPPDAIPVQKLDAIVAGLTDWRNRERTNP